MKKIMKALQKDSKDEKNIEDARRELLRLKKILDGAGFSDFVRYLRSPWRIMWVNFWAGVFRGLGILLGMTVVVALLVWFLTKMVDFPLIGQYFEEVLDAIKLYAPTNGIR
jgi:hypothetical protein